MIVTVNSMSEVDTLALAKIHSESYPDDHISGHLSKSLIIKYYSYFFDDLSKVKFFLDKSNNLEGFLFFGAGIPDKISQFKNENTFELLMFFLSRPNLAFRLILKKFISFFSKLDSFKESEYLILSVVSTGSIKGVGSKLIDAAFDYCLENKIPDLGLYVTCTNVRAINFYLRKGFFIQAYCKGQFYMQKDIKDCAG
jgi:GNAT superfamily N-acetyltransferase